jgi:selenocysteine lyase/cysteine desulfurase
MKNSILYLNNAATKPILTESFNEMNRVARVAHLITNRSAVSKNEYYKLIDEAKNVARKIVEDNCLDIQFLNTSTHIANILAQNFNHKSVAYSLLDHHSLQAPFNANCPNSYKFELTDQLDYDLEQARILFTTEKPEVILVTIVDNIIGKTSNYLELIELYRELVKNGIVIADAAQAVNYIESFKNLDYDYMFASVHKFSGPLGLGILWINTKNINNQKYLGGGNINSIDDNQIIHDPHNYTIGTINIAAIAGMIPAGKNLLKTKINANLAKIVKLRQKAESGLRTNNILIHHISNKQFHLCFTHKTIHAHDVVQYLASNNIIARAGNHCNSTLTQKINAQNSVRVSFDYNTNIEQLNFFLKTMQKLENDYLNFML